MPFQVSPGVEVIEKDFTSVVPSVSTSNGAFAAQFSQGPIEEPIRISSENELVKVFGKPNAQNAASWFTAANFLSYSNNLLVCRADNNSTNAVATPRGSVSASALRLTNAGSFTGYVEDTEVITLTFSAPQITGGTTAAGTAIWTGGTNFSITITEPGSGYTAAPTVTASAPTGGGTAATFNVDSIVLSGLKIKNLDQYISAGYVNGSAVVGPWAAKTPGSWANNMQVVVIDSGNWNVAAAQYKALFSGAPGTSAWAASKGISNDEMHILVLDNSLGSISGTAGSVLEKYAFLSKVSDAQKTDGSQNYYKNVINSNSQYIWWMDHITISSLSEFNNGVSNNYTNRIMTDKPAAFNGTNKTITITDNTAFATLALFKTFYDAAIDKTTRQIKLSSTTDNNSVFTVTNVATTLSGSTVTAYVITVLESLNTGSEATCIIDSVAKADWGSSSDAILTAEGAPRLKVFRSTIGAGHHLSILYKGLDDYSSSDSQLITAWTKFANVDDYDVSLLPLGNVSPVVANSVYSNVVSVRKDCMMFVSPRNVDNGEVITGPVGSTSAITLMTNYRDAAGLSAGDSSSYVVMDTGFKYQYDRYNDRYVWVPLNGDVAGLCARTDSIADPWFSPGGLNRGGIKNIVKLAYNPTQADRDVLYPQGINPVVTFKGQGTVLYGDRTLLLKPSAFDRINVRRLFIVLEKAIARAAKYQLFEFNDGFTRAQFKNLVEPFLRDVQGRRGIVDFRVVCDETNNTGEVIDGNRFVADIFIKPNRSINFITLNFIAARSGVSFEEIGA